MGKAIIFAGLVMAAIPASAQPECWWNGYSLQCDERWENPREDHWRREQWRRSHEEWVHRHREERR